MKALVFVVSVLALTACPADPNVECTSSKSVTLATDVQPLLTRSCATSNCHDSGYGSSFGDFSSATKSAAMVNKRSLYAGTRGTLKVVDPNALKNSTLWLKVLGGKLAGYTGPNGENVQDRMPYDADALSADEQQLLKDWICSGAK